MHNNWCDPYWQNLANDPEWCEKLGLQQVKVALEKEVQSELNSAVGDVPSAGFVINAANSI